MYTCTFTYSRQHMYTCTYSRQYMYTCTYSRQLQYMYIQQVVHVHTVDTYSTCTYSRQLQYMYIQQIVHVHTVDSTVYYSRQLQYMYIQQIVHIKIHVPSMLATGVETMNKQTQQTNTMAYKSHKTQPQRAQKILKQPLWFRKTTITTSHNGL